MGLRRELGLVDSIGIGLGAIVGAGIFVVTGQAAAIAGPAFLVGLLLAGAAASCNALSSAQLAAAYPQAGGTYEYGYRVLSPWAGFIAGWLFLLSKLTAGATVALGLGFATARVLPSVPPKTVSLAVVIFLTVANLFGIKKAGKINTIIVGLTLASLLAFIVVGGSSASVDNFQPFAPEGWLPVVQSAGLLFFAYTGYARLATLGEEVQEPKKTIPRAIVWAISLAIALYLAVAAVALGLVGAERMGDSTTPIQLAADSTGVEIIGYAVTAGAITAMLGVLLSQILGISRMMFAMARRADLPAGLASVPEHSGVPAVSVVLCGAVISTLVVIGTLTEVLSAATFTILLYYAIANLAALKMPKDEKLFRDFVPGCGLVLCLCLAPFVPGKGVVAGLVMIGVGVVWRLLWRRFTR